jgi:hypothetical protein
MVAESGPLADLSRRAGQQAVLIAELGGTVDPAVVRRLIDTDRAEIQPRADGLRLRIPTTDAAVLASRLATLAVEQGWQVRELRPQQQTLEDLFVRIVGQQEEPAVAVA